MFTAEYAKLKTDAQIDRTLADVFSTIDNSAIAGKYRIELPQNLLTAVQKRRLKELGFKVDINSAMQTVEISWYVGIR